jgi:hypothetical protein
VRTGAQQSDVEARRGALAQTFTVLYVSVDGTLLGGEPRFRPDTDGTEPFRFNAQPLPLPARETSLSGNGVPE